MTEEPAPPTRRRAGRAIALTAFALLAAVVTWRLRPAAQFDPPTPEVAIVAGCSWLAWALAGYLAVATAAVSVAHLLDRLGRAGDVIRRIAPTQLRRAVDGVLATGVAVTIVGTAGVSSAAAAPRPAVVAERAPLVAGSPLDWPGLTVTTSTGHDPVHHRPVHHHPVHHRPRPPDVGLVNGGHAGPDTVVVMPGDTLWRIAARSLGPGASGTAITAAWHDWYHANRDVIGSNPSIIHPGQHLVAPKGRTS